MKVEVYTGGYAATNGYLLQTNQATILIDAPAGVYQWLQDMNVEPTHLILTHQHWDHSHDASYFIKGEILAYAAPSEDLILQQRFRQNYGIPLEVKPYQVSRKLEDLECFSIGDLNFKAFHVPGHSVDSLAFYCQEYKMCFGGDVLMKRSCGRTDLPGGNAKQLINSIENVLFKLPDDTIVLSGHGPSTTVGEEKAENPYQLS